MIAQQDLIDAYAAWEQWTQREGAAIEAGNWRRVSECQQTKLDLQGRIIQLTDAVNAQCAEAGLDPKNFEPELRRIINDLIALETRNTERLSKRRRSAEAQDLELNGASRQLRQVQKSYVHRAPGAWHSYS